MDHLTWKHVAIIITALVVATVAEVAALILGYDGYLLAGYLGIIGSVAGAVLGVPIGFIMQKRRE